MKITEATNSGTVTVSVVVPFLLMVMISLAILFVRRSLQRKPYTSPFRHFVPSSKAERQRRKDGAFDGEIDITKPNFPPSPRTTRSKSFGRHSVRLISARFSQRLRRSSASMRRKLSIGLSGSSRVFFRRSSAPSSETVKAEIDKEIVTRGHSNPSLMLQDEHIKEWRRRTNRIFTFRFSSRVVPRIVGYLFWFLPDWSRTGFSWSKNVNFHLVDNIVCNRFFSSSLVYLLMKN